jgi:hypothetical protein
MSRCECGYCTDSKEEFVGHLVEGWQDLRNSHNLSNIGQ